MICTIDYLLSDYIVTRGLDEKNESDIININLNKIKIKIEDIQDISYDKNEIVTLLQLAVVK